VGRTFAALKNYQVDGNKEMMAIGLMNIAGSCSSCYVTTGNDSSLFSFFNRLLVFLLVEELNTRSLTPSIKFLPTSILTLK